MKTQRYFWRVWVGLGLISFLGGCAPTAYRLDPVSGDVAWIDGRPTTKTDENGLTLVASFERLDMQYVALDVELKNKTDQPVEINPADFQYVALNNDRDTLARAVGSLDPLILGAADPAHESERVALNQDREVKRLKRAKVVNTVLMVAAVAGTVAAASSSKNHSYEGWRSNQITQNNIYTAINAKRLIDHGTFANRMQQYDYEAYRWRELALKRTVVAPGSSARGLVYLPMTKDAAFMLVSYPVPENEPAALTFRQEWVKGRTQPNRPQQQ